jgi:hypothetical protein
MAPRAALRVLSNAGTLATNLLNDIATARGQPQSSHLLPTVTTPTNPPSTYA